MNTIETREVDAPRSATFRAASSALFDAGYIIGMSDHAGGLLTGEKQIDRSANRALLNADIPNTMFRMSIHVRELSPARCTVRIKTSIDGVAQTDKEEVDRIWLLMQRQVMMREPPKN